MSDTKDRLLGAVSPPLRLAERVRSAAERLAEIGTLQPADLAGLIFRGDVGMEVRLDAMTLLAAMEQPDQGWIHAALASEDKVVVIEALKSIRNFRPGWALSPLIVASKSDGYPDRRAVIAWALAAYSGNAEAEAVLIDLAESDRAPTVREHAIESLGEFRSSGVLNALIRSLRSASAPERFWALFSLGKLGDPAAAGPIRDFLDDHTLVAGFGTIADEAVRALGKIEDARSGDNRF